MSLKKRIEKLETSRGGSVLSLAEREMLVNILAKRDSIFWPWRWQANKCSHIPEMRRRQREYLAGSIGVAAKASGQNDWKSASAMRQSLIAAGHLAAVYSGGQVQSVVLTPLGEATSRALVGDRLNTFPQSLPVLVRLRHLSKQTSVRAVRESVLFGQELRGCPNDWDHLNELTLPLITAGCVFADSDTVGIACYVPIEGAPEPLPIEVDIESDQDLDDLYVHTFNSERLHLEAVEPRDQHEIIIPLPATGWGWPCHFPKEVTHDQQ